MKNDLRYLNLQFFGGRGASSGKKSSGDSVRDVPQSTIDSLKGTRNHMDYKTLGWQGVKDDYARVGISITEQEAKNIHDAIVAFSYGSDTAMRTAWTKYSQGRSLTFQEQSYLKQYKLCAEYCKIAPLIPNTEYKEIYRGIKFSTKTPEYAQGLVNLKPGDKWDVNRMPTSFSTSYDTARIFSHHMGRKGIIIHMPTQYLKNSPSIKGISDCPGENEVFVADYNWKVAKIMDQRGNGDGYYHIYLKK